MSDFIHKGIVQKRSGNSLEIEIVDGLECSSCSHKGSCHISDSNSDLLEVETTDKHFKEGDNVSIHLSGQKAISALFWGYLFPFIILMTSVIVFSLFFSEGVAGGITLLVLSVYYLLIYLNKKYFSKKFDLKVSKMS